MQKIKIDSLFKALSKFYSGCDFYLKVLTLILFLGFFSLDASSQIIVFAGSHYSYVRNRVLENEEGILSHHLGGGVKVYPVKAWKRISVDATLFLSEKGYKQHADKWQEFKFRYGSFQLISSYSLINFFSIDAGFELAYLIDTNIKNGNKTYNNFDAGLIIGSTLFENRPLAIYTRLIYGLTPILNYYSIDSVGNFKGEINDLKNTCVMIGVRFNVYDRKISL